MPVAYPLLVHVQEEGLVLVLGDEDLRQQNTELKEQIQLLRIAVRF